MKNTEKQPKTNRWSHGHNNHPGKYSSCQICNPKPNSLRRTFTVVYPDYQIVTMETSLIALEKARKLGTVMGWMEGEVKSSLPDRNRPHPFARIELL